MGYETVRRIAAEMDAVWAVLVDVEHWPDWTNSVTSVRCLDSGPLRVGSRARIKQPKLAAQVWTVTELADRSSFTWQARGPGITTVAGHVLEPDADGTVTATLSIQQHGPLGAVLGRVLGGLIRGYVTMEADGLKRVAEAA